MVWDGFDNDRYTIDFHRNYSFNRVVWLHFLENDMITILFVFTNGYHVIILIVNSILFL